MKKILYLFVVIFLIASVSNAAINTPTNLRVATRTVVDSIRVLYTINHSASVDSVRVLTASDSTLVLKFAAVDDSTLDIGGLTQGTAYTWIVLVDSAGVQSAPDSVTFTVADVLMPTFTMVSSTQNSITINITRSMGDSIAATDSLLIVTGPDSVSVVQVITPPDSTGSYTITGLNAWTQYIWRAKIDSANAVRSSTLDTLWTKRIQNEMDWGRSYDPSEKDKRMFDADSWSPTSTRIDSIILIGASDTDSTIWYQCEPYTNILVYATGDSSKFTAEVYSGYPGEDELTVWKVLQDSLVVTDAGYFNTGNLNIPASGWFYVRLRANTDNAEGGTTVKMRLSRSSWEVTR